MALNEQQRAERVLAANGRAIGMLGSFPPAVQTALASFCSEAGVITVGSRDDVEAVLNEHWETLKATVDEDAAPVAETEDNDG